MDSKIMLMNSKRKILIISLFALLVVSIVVAWYLMFQPQVVLALKYDKPLILLGGLLIESTRAETVLPTPLKPYTLPTIPNQTTLRIGFGSCLVTTAKGSAKTFLVFLSGNIDGEGVRQVTGGRLDYFVHEYIHRIYVDTQNALELLLPLGLPVELTQIDFVNSTVGLMNREMLIVSDLEGVTLLNLTLFRSGNPIATYPPEPKKDTNVKIGWIFGEEGGIKALRFKRDYNNGITTYPLVEGTLEVSSSSPIVEILGDTSYDIAKTLQQYFGVQGRMIPILDGGESHFIFP